MAIQKVSIDPNAIALSDNAVVAKVNAATTQITRAGCVSAVARPIETAEVGTTELAAGAVDNTILAAAAAKANLDAISPELRGYVATNPAAGEFIVTSLERKADGHIEFAYDDVAKPLDGIGDSFAFATPIVTLTDAAGLFLVSHIGKSITIAGSTSEDNDGTFEIISVPTAQTLTYSNTDGVAEAFTGTWSIAL